MTCGGPASPPASLHPIARRYWSAAAAGAERMFCSPGHERLYHDYWLPRYGAKEVS